MAGPQPLTGISGIRTVTRPNEATAPEKHGGPVDPAHQNWGEVAHPYPWEETQFGPYLPPTGQDPQMLGDGTVEQGMPAGFLGQDPESDQTPYNTHAAPWPKGLDGIHKGNTRPSGEAAYLQESADIHAADLGASRNFQEQHTMWAVQDQWEGPWVPQQGSSIQTPVTPQVGVAAGGFGSTDRKQNSLTHQNSYDFDKAHFHRRYATGSIPGNYMWLKPAGRPLVKSSAGPARPAVGPGPFQAQDTQTAYTSYGAILNQIPTEYVPPPTPAVQPSATLGEEVPFPDFLYGGSY